MSKLLTEPRIPKDIIAPIKKRRPKKTAAEAAEIKFTLLSEGNNGTVQGLFELYKKDPYKARVKYFSNKDSFNYRRLVIFEKGPKNFEITEFENKYGISVTNRIYSSQKKMRSIVYKNGKFYYLDNVRKKIRPLSMASMITFINDTESYIDQSDSHSKFKASSKTYTYLTDKFRWIQTVYETEAARGISFNSIVSKELFSQKDLLRHVFKVPMNIINIILEEPAPIYKEKAGDRHFLRASSRPRHYFDKIRQWNDISKALEGVQNLTSEFYHSHLFYDTCDMAMKLGRKVNCRWGLNHLRDIHDEWAKDLRNILLDCELEYKLKIHQGYFGFANYSGFKLLFTNKEMLVEGVRQNHCVGGYIDRVQRGECAIFHIDGFTLQVKISRVMGGKKGWVAPSSGGFNIDSSNIDEMLRKEYIDRFDEEPKMMHRLINAQFRGLRNVDPPIELVTKANKLLSDYSLTDEFQNLMDKKVELDPQILGDILKTRWEVVINHETNKYEIKEDVEEKLFTQEEIKQMKKVTPKVEHVGLNRIEQLPF